MIAIQNRARTARIGRTLCYALAAVSLAACGGGGGGGGSSASSDSALKITESNAPAVTNQLLETTLTLPNIPQILYSMGEGTTCDAGGTNTTNDTGTQTSFHLSNCKPVYDDTEKVVINGDLLYTFGGSPYPLTLEIDGFSLSDMEYDSSGSKTFDARIRANGTFTADTEYNLGANGSFSIQSQDSGGGANNVSADWAFKNYLLNLDGSGTGPMNINGRQTLSNLGGYVDITTGMDLAYDSGSACPIAGRITADGADSTYVRVDFDGGDTVTVTVNGNATAYDCAGFQTWAGEVTSPFALSLSTGRSLDRSAPAPSFRDLFIR